jgi:ribosomal protein L11 methyltransferase
MVPVTESNKRLIEEQCYALGAEAIIDENRAYLTILTKTPQCFLDYFKQARIEPIHTKKTWIDHYSGAKLTSSVAIKAIDRPIKKNLSSFETIIELDLEGAFGDGLHPTTQLCAEALTTVSQYSEQQTLLDIGTGTAILAILGEILGYKKVVAIDNDIAAIQKAKINTQHNHCKNIALKIGECSEINSQHTYDCLVANVLTVVILKNISNFQRLIKHNGYMILSGISRQWMREVLDALKKEPLIVVSKKVRRGWGCIIAKKSKDIIGWKHA